MGTRFLREGAERTEYGKIDICGIESDLSKSISIENMILMLLAGRGEMSEGLASMSSLVGSMRPPITTDLSMTQCDSVCFHAYP